MLSVRKSILFGLALSFAPGASASNAEALRGTLTGVGNAKFAVPPFEAEETKEMEMKRLHFLNTHIGTQYPFSNPVTWQAGRFTGTFSMDSEQFKNGSKGRFQKVVNPNIPCLRYTHKLNLAGNATEIYNGRGNVCMENGTWTLANAGEVFQAEANAPAADTAPRSTPQVSVDVPAPTPKGLDNTYAYPNLITAKTVGDMVHQLQKMNATLKATLDKDTRLANMAEESKRKFLRDSELMWTRYYAAYFAWGLQATQDRAAIKPMMGSSEKTISFEQLKFLVDELASDEGKLALLKVFLGFEWEATDAKNPSNGKWKRVPEASTRIDFRPAKLRLVTASIRDANIKAELERDALMVATKEGMRNAVADDLSSSSTSDSPPKKRSNRRR